jgi:hypothetical protein
VSRHDDVSAYIRNIDRTISEQPSCALAAAGTKRKQDPLSDHSQRTDASDAPAPGSDEPFMMLSDDHVLIDTAGNVPLRLAVTSAAELPKLAREGLRPRLRLTSAQREMDRQQGTVLLLGRAGTGKTMCLCERMVEDRERAELPGGLRQLFVCRSARVCALARGIQASQCGEVALTGTDFLTLNEFLKLLLGGPVAPPPGRRTYTASRRVDYERFRAMLPAPRPVKRGGARLDALVLWTQIRSFIKGSIEAARAGRPLTLEEYLDLAPERCRLAPHQRREAYAVFQEYESRLVRDGLWDDSGRVMDVLIQWLCDCQPAATAPCSALYDRVYVDEVQDCTQAEVALCFLAVGCNSQALFLAGDPAQAVAEGVDFRFEEVRGIVYELSCGMERLERPVQLAVNYRSHAGILSCASAVLRSMFSLFPGSAKVLYPDRGIFNGPKPSYWRGGRMPNGPGLLQSILSRGCRCVVVCPDELRSSLAIMLPDNLVFGIREAKGLEFPDVAIVDFFSGLPIQDQATWPRLLKEEDCGVIAASALDAAAACPHAETQLKLLYTAITRSCRTLIFAETSESPAGAAFFQWLQDKELAEPYVLMAAESDSAGEAMDYNDIDELRMQGLGLAAAAVSEESEAIKVTLLEKAAQCFSMAGYALPIICSRMDV